MKKAVMLERINKTCRPPRAAVTCCDAVAGRDVGHIAVNIPGDPSARRKVMRNATSADGFADEPFGAWHGKLAGAQQPLHSATGAHSNDGWCGRTHNYNLEFVKEGTVLLPVNYSTDNYTEAPLPTVSLNLFRERAQLAIR